MVIQHNVMADFSVRMHKANRAVADKSLEKLASGYKVNRAADDAAGLAISEKMRAQVTGLGRAELNAKDGVSLVQTAEGAMTEVHSMLNRMEELAVEAANGIYDEVDRGNIDSEVQALKEEINRISQATNFNGIPLLDGSLSNLGSVSAGTVAPQNIVAPQVEIPAPGASLGGAPANFRREGTGPISVAATPAGPGANSLTFSIAKKDGSGTLEYTINLTGQFTKTPNLNYSVDISPFGSIPVQNSASGMGSVSLAMFTSGLASVLNGNMPTISPTDNELVLQVGDTGAEYNMVKVSIDDMSTIGLNIDGLKLLLQGDGGPAINMVNEAINQVSTARGNLGATQNRLEHTIQNLQNVRINVTDSESRIRDADMAKEMMEMTKGNILDQAAQSMMAHASQTPNQVLSLLR